MSDLEKIKQLRNSTGAGFKDCNSALKESAGDLEKAVEILRVKGISKASKKMSREAKEGVIALTESENKTSVLEVNCETDFVAKNEDFQELASKILDTAFDNKLSTVEEILSSSLGSLTIEQEIVNLIGKIGEKIEIREYKSFQGEKIVPYIHAGNKLGVLVSLVNTSSVDYVAAGKDVAMQIAAMNPIALNKDGVDQSVIDKEIEIGKEQALKEGKPENIVEKIAQGKLQKFFKDNTLLSQPFVKDNSMSIESYLGTFSSELTVDKFLRVSIG